MVARKRDHLRTRNPQFSFCALPSQQPVPGKYNFPGGIAQLVERQLCKLDVRGSNPLASKWSFKFVRIKCFKKSSTSRAALLKTYKLKLLTLFRACSSVG